MKKVALSSVEAVGVQREGDFVRLTLFVGPVAAVSKLIRPAAAQSIADALGFACNDVQFAARERRCTDCPSAEGATACDGEPIKPHSGCRS